MTVLHVVGTPSTMLGPATTLAIEDHDVVVMGSHSGSLADRLFVGNVTEKIVRRSPVPVTVAR